MAEIFSDDLGNCVMSVGLGQTGRRMMDGRGR